MPFAARLVIAWLVNIAALWVADALFDGVSSDGWVPLVIAAAVLGVVNSLLKPVLTILSIPFIILTLGLFLLLINIAMLALTAWIVSDFDINGFWAYVGTVIVVWLVTSSSAGSSTTSLDVVSKFVYTSKMSMSAVACCAPLGAAVLSDDEAEATAAVFRALSDPARVRIVNVLATSDEPVCVCELTAPLGLAQPTVSPPHEEAARRGSPRARAAGEVGLLLADRATPSRLAPSPT